MKCCLRLLTYVVNTLLVLSLSFGAVLTRSDIEKIAIKELESFFGNRVKLKSINPYFRTPLPYIRIEKVALQGVEGQPRASLHIHLSTHEGIKRVSVALNLLWKCSLLVAKRRIERGERLHPEKVALKDIFMDRCPRQWIGEKLSLINYVAIRPIERGIPIKISYLKKEHLVKRGESVKLLLRQGNIEIEILGEALDNGFLGDRIRVKIPQTLRIIRGTVVDEGIILVR